MRILREPRRCGLRGRRRAGQEPFPHAIARHHRATAGYCPDDEALVHVAREVAEGQPVGDPEERRDRFAFVVEPATLQLAATALLDDRDRVAVRIADAATEDGAAPVRA